MTIKEYFTGRKKGYISLLVVIVMLIGMLPLTAIANISGNYEIVSKGISDELSDCPTALKEGQIWVEKRMVSMDDDRFEITLYVWGSQFKGAEVNEWINPLDPDNPYVTVKDILGDFQLVSPVEGLEVDAGTVTWVVHQDDILNGGISISYTVELRDDWAVDTKYWTGEADAVFVPVEGNPYYWTTTETIRAAFVPVFSWNGGNGINSGTIADNILNFTLVFGASNNCNTERNSAAGPFTLPATPSWGTGSIVGSTTKFQWHLVWFKGGPYHFYVRGLDDRGDIVYEVFPGNPGGNDGIAGGRTISSFQHFRRSNVGWVTSNEYVQLDLPVKGWIELTSTQVVVDPIVITVNKSISRNDFATIPDDAVFTFKLNGGDLVAPITANISGAQYKGGNTSVTLTIPGATYANDKEERTYHIVESITGANWAANDQLFTVVVAADGYKINGVSDATSVTFANTYNYVPVGYLSVIKTWDASVPLKERVDVTFDLVDITDPSNPVVVVPDAVLVKDVWRADFSTENGGPIKLGRTYVVVEKSLENPFIVTDFADRAGVSPSFAAEAGAAVTPAMIEIGNTYNVLSSTLIIEKKWDHKDGEFNNTPYFDAESVTFLINGTQIDGVTVATKTLTVYAEGGWKDSITLPYGTYTIDEVSSTPNYILDTSRSNSRQDIVLGKDGKEVVIWNKYQHPQGSLTIAKDWKLNGVDAYAPEGAIVTVQVYRNGSYHGTVTLSSANEWNDEIVFDLPGDHSVNYDFTVKEIASPSNYTQSVSYNNNAANGYTRINWDNPEGGAVVTNDDQSNNGKLIITKVWYNGDENSIGIPESIIIRIESEQYAEGFREYELRANEAGEWELILTGVALGVYTITEHAAPDDTLFGMYTSSKSEGITVVVTATDLEQEAAFANTLGKGFITLQKIWEVGDDYRSPRGRDVRVAVYGTPFIGAWVPEIDVETGDPAFDDETGEALGYYDTPVEELIWNGTINSRRATIIPVPLDYDYRVEELSSFTHYDTSYKVNGGAAGIEAAFSLTNDADSATVNVQIVNTFTSPGSTLSVLKFFEGNAQPAGGHQEIEFYLYENGVPVSVDGEPMVFATKNHEYIFSTDASYAGYGSEYVLRIGRNYSIREIAAENYSLLGYEPAARHGNTRSGSLFISRDGSDQSITVKNVYIVPMSKLTVVKIWDDEGFQFNRPERISVTLMRKIDSERFARGFTGNTIMLEADSDGIWSDTFHNLPVYDDNGNKYTYYITEGGANILQYITRITDEGGKNIMLSGIQLVENAERVVSIKNTANNLTIRGRLGVEKEWISVDGDEFPEDLIRDVSVQLLANGRPTAYFATLTENNGWSASWNVFVMDIHGNPIEYTVRELTKSEHWTWNEDHASVKVAVSGKATLGLVNTYVPFEGEIDIVKEGNNPVIVDGSATIRYKLTVTNDSNKTMTDIEIVDVFDEPDKMTLAVGSIVGATLVSYDEETGELVLIVSGPLAPEASTEITYNVIVTEVGTFRNYVEVTAIVEGEDDRLPPGNDEEDSLVTAPDLAIVKELVGPSANVTANGNITFSYRLTISNNGVHDIFNLVVTDTMIPSNAGAGMTLSSNHPGFDPDTNTWAIDVLLAGRDGEYGDIVEINYTITVDSAGTYDNTAAVTGEYEDEDENRQDIVAESDKVTVNVRRPEIIIRDPDDPTPPPTTPITPPPTPPVIEEFEDDAPPLVEQPPIYPEEVEIEFDFEDDAPPLSEMPKTGVNDNFRIWIFALIFSLTGLGTLCFAVDYTTRKTRKKK